MRGGFLILISVSFFLFTIFAVASESSLLLDQAMRNEDMNASIEFRKISISTGESFRKTQLVYQIFGIPPEADYQPELDLLVPTTSPEYVSTLLKSLDPSNQFGRFFDKSENALNGFRDRDEKKQIEFKLALASRELPAKPQMNGIRIAIDPGHMGGTDWDQRTGKFVRGEKNLYLSEGILNLITTHLLAEKLREKGAQVMITHEDAGPVSEMKYEELNLREFAKKELRSRSLSDWFLALLQGNSDQNLEAAFSNANAVKKLNSEIMRSDYYTMREDLYARTAKIKEFKPDLTLFIHFDADKPNPDPKFRNITRAYVPGAFGQSELATSHSRSLFLSHLATDKTWKRSVELSELIIDSISKNLNVLKPEADMESALRVAPGVFARNLALTRMVTSSPIAYLECLSYGNSAEFSRLTKTDGGSMRIGKKDYAYSKRLVELADAIFKGIDSYLTR